MYGNRWCAPMHLLLWRVLRCERIKNDKEESKPSTHLSKEFDTKIITKLRYFLNIEVTYFKVHTFISKYKYIIDLFKEIVTSMYKYVVTLIDPNHILGHVEGDKLVD